tara:strand:+ start:264 stop:1106 length:843 start_codon:yes stop_codon:yes gene_type:complete
MKNIYDDLSSVSPLFLIGTPRSGTTLLHQIVNAHEEVFITDELRQVSWLINQAKMLTEGYHVHGSLYPFNHGPEFANYLINNAGTLLAPYYYLHSDKYGKKKIKYWGDKYPNFDQYLGKMMKMFPRAKYVMIHRDLRDVMASVKKGHQWTTDKTATYVCDIYKLYIHNISRMAPVQCINIRYEDLVFNIDTTSKKIFRYLGLSYDDHLFKKIIKISNIQSHSVRGKHNKSVKFNKSKATGKWKNFFDESERDLIECELEAISDELSKGNALCDACDDIYS